MNSGEIQAWHYATHQPVRLKWSGGLITELEAVATAPENQWLAPGLFDPQVNGYGGIDFQQDNLTADDLLSATRQLRTAGCTRFLLTLITDEWPKLTARLRHLRTLRSQSAELQSAIIGWHIEGPFLSAEPGFCGAHNPALMLDPSAADIQALRTITGNDPFLLTVAPERPGVLEAIALATSLGIKISLGHTNASAEILQKAVKAGATAFTHLANGCPRELDRHDNILWRVFETRGLTVGLIPDQIHVSPTLFRLIHRTLGPNSIYYTTDAMSAAGAPPGKYKLAGLELEVGIDQVVRQPGKTNFAGSALRPIDGVFRAAQMLNRPWQEVWKRFSEIPASMMGLSQTLEIGQPADFCLLKFTRENQLTDLKVISQATA
ncbi:MAG: N-acetylglucosamine-6-phosphate deacetylase [Pedosphaera sp.]|nr:N-acetylglucosamine-6-phosphate deacetylase [Pedosphaera sp.]